MITEPIESNRNSGRGFHREASDHGLKDASQRLLLYCGQTAAAGASGSATINPVSVRNSAMKDPIRRAHAVDIVKQIHDTRSSFSSLVARSPFDDKTGRPATSLHPSSLEMFVEGIAHHFNNLFMAIQGYVSLLIREIEPDHAGMRHLRRIEKLVHCESILANDLLRFLIGHPYRIRRRARIRLIRELEKIATTVETTAQPRGAPGGSQAASGPNEQLLRSLSGSVAIILGRLLSDIRQQAAEVALGINDEARAFQRLRQVSNLTLQGLRPVCQLLGYAGHTHLPNGHRVARCDLVDTLQKTAASKGKNIRLFMDVDADLQKIKLRHRQLVQILTAAADWQTVSM